MAKKITLRRVGLGLTQTDVVERIEDKGEAISRKTISKVESGDYTIQSETYEKILGALGIDGYELEIRFNEDCATVDAMYSFTIKGY